MNTNTGSPSLGAPPRRDWPLSLVISAGPALPVVLALGHLLGLWGLLLSLAVVAAFSVILTRPWPRSRALEALSLGYGLAQAVLWFGVADAFLRPMDPTGFALWLGMSLAYVPFAMVGGRAWTLYVALFALFLGWIGSRMGKPVAYGALALGLAWAWRRRCHSPEILRAWPRTLLHAPVLALPLAGFVLVLRFAERGDLAERVLAQQQVKALWTIGSESWPATLSPQVRFVMDLCVADALLVGAAGNDHAASLVRWDRRTGGTSVGRAIRRSSNMAAVDCERGRFFVGSESTHEIVEYALDRVTSTGQVWNIPGSEPRFLALFGKGRYLAVVDDGTFRHHLVDTFTGSVHHLPELHPSKCVFERKGELWVTWGSPSRQGVGFDIVSVETGSPVLRQSGLLFGGAGATGPGRMPADDLCTFDRVGDQLFFSDLFYGRITRLRLTPTPGFDQLDLERGVRFVAVEPSRRLLAVANYVTGSVVFLGADDLSRRGEVFLGPRVRWLDFSADGRSMYTASSTGIFEVDLGPYLPESDRAGGTP
ncbi:MAG: hypothetical protein HYY13_00220 [Nitrospirae bacterium]|nr:hypothetical protein [Nitrospirota bacterium]